MVTSEWIGEKERQGYQVTINDINLVHMSESTYNICSIELAVRFCKHLLSHKELEELSARHLIVRVHSQKLSGASEAGDHFHHEKDTSIVLHGVMHPDNERCVDT